MAALKLLEAPCGPVLESFPEDAPKAEDSSTGWACPIDLSEDTANPTDTEQLRLEFKREANRMRVWHDMSVSKRGRTTFGAGGLDAEAVFAFVAGFLDGGIPANPRADLPLALVLKLAVDDLKAYYLEAAVAEPGETEPSSAALADWFWKETVAAQILRTVKRVCEESSDPMLKITGQRLIVPMAYL